MVEDQYYFDEEAADRVCRFFETQLFHWKGEYAGKPFKLLPWQRKILRDVFGTKRKADHTRRYRFVYVEVPRKAGKTFFASGLAVYLTCADNEPGAEVYSAAMNREQSGYTLDNFKQAVYASRLLSKRIRVLQHKCEHPASRSRFKALSGEGKGSHGKNIHGLVIDELHEWVGKNAADLFEALVTSMGSRRQPLTCCITTAGHGGEITICRELHNKAEKYLSGEVKPGAESYDDTFYPVLYSVGKDEPWDDPETWRKANPSLGESVSVDYYRRECVKAKESAAYENTFRRLYLCQWTEQTTRWLSLDKYDACTKAISLDELEGEPCYLGVDLSQSYDLTAVVQVFPRPDGWIVYPHIYCPEDSVAERTREDAIPYSTWVKEGHLIPTPGKTVDYDRIEQDIVALAERFKVVEAAFDPYNAGPMIRHLENAGIEPCLTVDQNFRQMGPPSAELERRIVNGKITFHNNPVLRWAAANVEVKTHEGQIRPIKPNAKGKYAGTAKYKIDPLVATILGISRAMLRDGMEQEFNAATSIIVL